VVQIGRLSSAQRVWRTELPRPRGACVIPDDPCCRTGLLQSYNLRHNHWEKGRGEPERRGYRANHHQVSLAPLIHSAQCGLASRARLPWVKIQELNVSKSGLPCLGEQTSMKRVATSLMSQSWTSTGRCQSHGSCRRPEPDAERVGWVEHLRNPSCFVTGQRLDRFRFRSNHPTSSYGYSNANECSEFLWKPKATRPERISAVPVTIRQNASTIGASGSLRTRRTIIDKILPTIERKN
jgi:hypothetical protein